MPLHLLDNLSNLSDPVSARSALGLGTTDSPTFSGLSATTINAAEYDVTGTDGVITSTTDILTWVLGSKSFAIGNTSEDLDIKPDGSIMYLLIAGTTRAVRSYPLSAAWDVTTASSFTSKSVSTLDLFPRGLYFSPDGTNMFVTGTVTPGGIIGRYTIPLSAAWDISQASTNAVETLSLSATVSDSGSAPVAIYFKPDGSKMFIADDGSNRIYEFGLSSAWALSSVTYSGVFTSSVDTIPQGLTINKDGTRMFILGGAGDRIQEVRLNTAWSLSSTTFVNATLFTTPDFGPAGVYFNDETYKCFTTGNSNTVREVLIGPNLRIAGTNSTLRVGDITASKTVTGNTLISTLAGNTGTAITVNSFNPIVWLGGGNSRITGWSGRISFGEGSTEWGRFSGAQFRCANFQVGSGTDNGTVSFTSGSIGTLTMTGVGGDFNILQLGGTSASFPAIKRNGTGIDIRDATDTNYTTLAAGTFVVNDNIVNQADDFTLSGTDAGKYIRLTKPTGTQTISLTGSGIQTGREFTFYRATSATLALNGGTVNGGSNISSVPQFGAFALKHIGSGTFDFI